MKRNTRGATDLIKLYPLDKYVACHFQKETVQFHNKTEWDLVNIELWTDWIPIIRSWTNTDFKNWNQINIKLN